jgi:uncharacterized protein
LKFVNQYIIHFKGLKEGVHDFEFKISKPFFEEFEHLEIPDGEMDVTVQLDKKANLLDLFVSLSGKIQVQCDRCLEYFELPVDFQGDLIVKFSETTQDTDDEVMFLDPGEHELSLKHYFYECICLSIPYRKVHPDLKDGKPGCNREMLSKLASHLIEE